MVTVLSAAVYAVLLCAPRVVGRRSPNMMTPFEMGLMFLLGGIRIRTVPAQPGRVPVVCGAANLPALKERVG
jgi:uncharacterized membrane protein YcaP (DUF421 family)